MLPVHLDSKLLGVSLQVGVIQPWAFPSEVDLSIHLLAMLGMIEARSHREWPMRGPSSGKQRPQKASLVRPQG